MLVFEPYPGTRVVAVAAAIDSVVAAFPSALRFADDEAFIPGIRPEQLMGGAGTTGGLPADEHAIVEPDAGWSATSCSWAEFEAVVAPYLEWALPTDRPAIAQGLLAAVPVKLVVTADGVAIVTQTAYARDLAGRLR